MRNEDSGFNSESINQSNSNVSNVGKEIKHRELTLADFVKGIHSLDEEEFIKVKLISILRQLDFLAKAPKSEKRNRFEGHWIWDKMAELERRIILNNQKKETQNEKS